MASNRKVMLSCCFVFCLLFVSIVAFMFIQVNGVGSSNVSRMNDMQDDYDRRVAEMNAEYDQF